MLKIYLTAAFAILLLAAPKLIFSQSPAMSVEQNFLSKVDLATCNKRAKEALAKFNLTARDTGNEYCLGNNAEYTVAIFCDQCGTAVNVNVTVAANKSVGEVIKLREQILKFVEDGTTAESSNSAGGSAMLWLQKPAFGVSEPVAIYFSGLSGDAKDWIAVTPASEPDNVRGSWKYTGGDKDGSLIWQEGLPAGEYEARAYFKNSWTVEKRMAFTVR